MTALAWVALAGSLLAFLLYFAARRKAMKEGFTGRWIAYMVLAIFAIFILYLAPQSRDIEPAEWAQILLLAGLVAVTGIYAMSATRQADASAKMAEEAEEQRIIASRPVIIQRAVNEQSDVYFSNFEIYNAGNGPAIELTTAVLTEGKDSYKEARRVTYLRAGVTPISFNPSDIEGMADSKTYYLVSIYQGILSRTGVETRYETWLPFKVARAGREGEFYVTGGELVFQKVSKEDSIEKLISWGRPE